MKASLNSPAFDELGRGMATQARAATRSTESAPRRRGRPRSPKGPTKERISSYLSIELMDRARNAAYWTPGLTVASLLEAGLSAELEKRERRNGGRFPSREGEAA